DAEELIMTADVLKVADTPAVKGQLVDELHLRLDLVMNLWIEGVRRIALQNAFLSLGDFLGTAPYGRLQSGAEALDVAEPGLVTPSRADQNRTTRFQRRKPAGRFLAGLIVGLSVDVKKQGGQSQQSRADGPQRYGRDRDFAEIHGPPICQRCDVG